jgi:fluoride ion exporter CrcB/FEX
MWGYYYGPMVALRQFSFLPYSNVAHELFVVFIINAVACFLAGFATELITSGQTKHFFITGLLGGLSTLAAIDVFFVKWHTILGFVAFGNLIGTVVVGLFTCYFGIKLAQKMKRKKDLKGELVQ